jgi:hypothetical protein
VLTYTPPPQPYCRSAQPPYSSAKKERDTDEKRRNFVRNILKKDSNNHRTPARPTDIAKERKNDARL